MAFGLRKTLSVFTFGVCVIGTALADPPCALPSLNPAVLPIGQPIAQSRTDSSIRLAQAREFMFWLRGRLSEISIVADNSASSEQRRSQSRRFLEDCQALPFNSSSVAAWRLPARWIDTAKSVCASGARAIATPGANEVGELRDALDSALTAVTLDARDTALVRSAELTTSLVPADRVDAKGQRYVELISAGALDLNTTELGSILNASLREDGQCRPYPTLGVLPKSCEAEASFIAARQACITAINVSFFETYASKIARYPVPAGRPVALTSVPDGLGASSMRILAPLIRSGLAPYEPSEREKELAIALPFAKRGVAHILMYHPRLELLPPQTQWTDAEKRLLGANGKLTVGRDFGPPGPMEVGMAYVRTYEAFGNTRNPSATMGPGDFANDGVDLPKIRHTVPLACERHAAGGYECEVLVFLAGGNAVNFYSALLGQMGAPRLDLSGDIARRPLRDRFVLTPEGWQSPSARLRVAGRMFEAAIELNQKSQAIIDQGFCDLRRANNDASVSVDPKCR